MKVNILILLLLLFSCDHKHGNKKFQKDLKQWVQIFENDERDVYKHRKQIVAALDLKKGEIVADIGAGTGAFLKLLHEKVTPLGKIYAVDISDEFVEHMKKRKERENLDNLIVVKGKTEATTLLENSIDVAFICNTYHHFGDFKEMLRDIKKVLKKNGRLFIVEFDKIPGKSRQWIIDHIRAEKKVFLNEIVSAGFKYEGEIDIPFKENFMLNFSLN
ncbi:MAG: SAM-dependent methyltransferase [Epsilonproteobacteria bacterium]|nr:MAG: SAM-dependent methyltransferase [Campylobacterota bacterium]RLA66339.1 MAG: SAM-dependent methyltransferase [Campylobacterota bacterium]